MARVVRACRWFRPRREYKPCGNKNGFRVMNVCIRIRLSRETTTMRAFLLLLLLLLPFAKTARAAPRNLIDFIHEPATGAAPGETIDTSWISERSLGVPFTPVYQSQATKPLTGALFQNGSLYSTKTRTHILHSVWWAAPVVDAAPVVAVLVLPDNRLSFVDMNTGRMLDHANGSTSLSHTLQFMPHTTAACGGYGFVAFDAMLRTRDGVTNNKRDLYVAKYNPLTYELHRVYFTDAGAFDSLDCLSNAVLIQQVDVLQVGYRNVRLLDVPKLFAAVDNNAGGSTNPDKLKMNIKRSWYRPFAPDASRPRFYRPDHSVSVCVSGNYTFTYTSNATSSSRRRTLLQTADEYVLVAFQNNGLVGWGCNKNGLLVTSSDDPASSSMDSDNVCCGSPEAAYALPCFKLLRYLDVPHDERDATTGNRLTAPVACTSIRAAARLAPSQSFVNWRISEHFTVRNRVDSLAWDSQSLDLVGSNRGDAATVSSSETTTATSPEVENTATNAILAVVAGVLFVFIAVGANCVIYKCAAVNYDR